MSKKDEKRMISVDEATELLPEGDHIHTFRNPGPNALIGADISREKIIQVITANAKTLQIGGDACRTMGHGLVIIDELGPLFIATDRTKLDSFDPVN